MYKLWEKKDIIIFVTYSITNKCFQINEEEIKNLKFSIITVYIEKKFMEILFIIINYNKFVFK